MTLILKTLPLFESHGRRLTEYYQIIKRDLRCLSSSTNLWQNPEQIRNQKYTVLLKRSRSVLRLNRSSQCLFHTQQILFESKTINCPPFAESISEGDVKWERGIGDSVTEDETVAEIETDKTSIPIPSPFGGVIEKLLVEDGTTVTPGTPLFVINTDGAPEPIAKPEEPTPQVETEPSAPPKHSEPAKPKETPLEKTQLPKTMPPIPTLETNIPPVLHPAPPVPKEPISRQPLPEPIAAISQVATSRPAEKRVKMNRMRQRIAQRLKDSQNTAAMLTTFNEVDMTNLIDLRNTHKEAFLKKHGIKLSFMSGFIKASAYALADQPVVNAVIDDDTKEIVYRDYIDISVAVATPRGLVVPVLRNCGPMNYFEIEKEMNVLAGKARNNELAVEDMDGGTFTISNGGVFGSMFGTPIINPPQSAILGMHGIFDRPVAINKEVKVRPMMYIALTYDHRLVDGREAVTFLRKIKQAVEDPHVLLLDL